jgi:hypothetical protein
MPLTYNNMKNLEKRNGFKNRHIDGLPTEKVIMKVIINDIDGENIILCAWQPLHKENIPSSGYLGTAKVIDGYGIGFHAWELGFHAWEQNNSEFVYYSIIN